MIHPDVSAAVALFRLSGTHPATAATDSDSDSDSGVDIEGDNAEYGAVVARIESRRVRFRVGRVTPKKVGLFVAVWRRAPSGSTEPFPVDDVDLLVILTREGHRTGQFVFPRSALKRHDIVSVAGHGGKRGFRVYPPWSTTGNAQAIRTQAWQGAFFLDTSDGIDPDRLRSLLGS